MAEISTALNLTKKILAPVLYYISCVCPVCGYHTTRCINVLEKGRGVVVPPTKMIGGYAADISFGVSRKNTAI